MARISRDRVAVKRERVRMERQAYGIWRAAGGNEKATKMATKDTSCTQERYVLEPERGFGRGWSLGDDAHGWQTAVKCLLTDRPC